MSRFNVYAVVSETMHEISYDRMDEEYWAIAMIVSARSRGQARYIAAKIETSYGDPREWPAMWVKSIPGGRGYYENPGPVGEPDASKWWACLPNWNPGRNQGKGRWGTTG